MKASRFLFVSAAAVFAFLCVLACSETAWAEAAPVPASGQSAEEKVSTANSSATINIPGPLRSFLRMAGISQKVSREEVLPLLARNVFAQGYEGWQGRGQQTEYLILLIRYVQQARELSGIAGPQGVIQVANCDAARPLLHVLGYKLRQECGQKNTELETADPDRAFLTIDSGFPLHELERTLQGGQPFSYPFPSSAVPLIFNENDWKAVARENNGDLLDLLTHDPVLARLYWAFSRLDPETEISLRQSPGLAALLPLGPAMDFYGSQISVRSGRVLVPGGAEAEPAWKELVGASPESSGDFVARLLAKDNGWLAAYFDVMLRIPQAQQAHFTQTKRLRRCYEAFRSFDPSASATRAAFRPAPGLLLLMTRLQWESNDQPEVPGNLEVWRDILHHKSGFKMAHAWNKRIGRLDDPEELLEALCFLAREDTDAGPMQAYLALSELDTRRPREQRLSPETVRLLATRFADFSDQYLIFSEFPTLSDESITQFLNISASVNGISDHTLRGNVMGTFQAEIGIWQILARQGQIPHGDLNNSWQRVIRPFGKVTSSPQLFDAGCNSLDEIIRAATGKAEFSQDEIINLLAGPHQTSADGQQMHREVADRMRTVLDGQRLVSLDTLSGLGEGLNEMAHGKAVGDSLIPLAGELTEFEMPRPMFTGSERAEWAAGVYNNHHTDLQMKTNLTKVIRAPGSHAQLEQARGQLASFFRDTVVGLNYAYYEPPGAQSLHNNPLFVRSHDFSGETVTGVEHVWQAPLLFGEGSPAGGGAHLVGSLADLPYVLAEVEQDFIAPENVQALIWRELVPGLLTSATVPRWWSVSRNEMHAVALYQRAGEELLTTATEDEQLRGRLLNILSDRMAPDRLEEMRQAWREKHIAGLFPRMMPADTFYLAIEFQRKFPGEIEKQGPAGRELQELCERQPAETSWQRLSHDFGVPHPILAQSYGRELLNVRPFPALAGYSSRLLAESWDSNNLYWARLADEAGYAPVTLNRLVPELTRRMVEKIFATDFEDWPAILRALHETGDEFRQGKFAFEGANGTMAKR